MSRTITLDLSHIPDAVQPVLDAIETLIQSTIVPLQSQLNVTKQINGQPPTSVVVTLPDSVPDDQVWNLYRRLKLETGILSSKLGVPTPAGIPIALSAVVFEVPAYGQPV